MRGATVVDALVRLQFAAGPIIPYIPQLLSLRSGKSSDGFSPNVSLVILVANTLRVAFWFRKRFDNTMLVQSLLLIGMQLALLQALAGSKWALAKREGRQLALSPVGDFWAWDSFALYLGATALFASVVALVSSVLYRFEWYVEGLGAAAVSFESVMGLPQLTRNFMHKSTAGLSIFMVCGWLGGDFLKVAYFVAKGVPMVFFYGAAVQTALDASVALQLFVLYPNDDIKALLRRLRHPFKPRRSPRASSSAAAAALNGRSPRKSPRRVSYSED
eukprot:TRINITY_DN20944_c0_g1_i1.p1 TRINITY_DN20944_c0_g1~~TRINITY_DN20944_c0_g1_i1.p1  ORF type:complete len:274 (+),score=103.31 TRINITY_DN20944_c0_g1_i1:187-1008(+)